MYSKFSRIALFVLFFSQGFAQINFMKDSLDVYVERELKRWNLPGLALAIVKDGKVEVIKGYGYCDTQQKNKVTENTLFQIASNTKAFTGTSLALLEHYGKLKLNDKVVKHLPYFKLHEEWKTREASILDLLTHRLGYSTFQSDLLNWGCTRTRRELIENMVNVVPAHGFRERYGYCNVGFLTAGEIIPAVCDTSWDDYLKHHYFVPLGMNSTSTRYSDFIKSDKASKGYTLFDGKLYEVTPSNVDNIGPAGSITSSVNDLSKWVLMQLANGKYDNKVIVPEKVIARTRQSYMVERTNSRKGNNFNNIGLGWFLADADGKKVVTHDGGALGFLSKTLLVPEENFGFVILSNLDEQYFFEALGQQLLNDLLKRPYKNLSASYFESFKNEYAERMATTQAIRKKADAYKSSKTDYQKLSGVYKNAVYGRISIDAKADYAEVSFEYHPNYKGRLTFMGKDSLMLDYNDPSLGVQEIKFKNQGDVRNIEIKVNGFIDYDTYLFDRIGEPVKFNKN